MSDEMESRVNTEFTNNTKIRVGAVSYLNTKPLIYGFELGMMKDEIELTIDYPSKVARSLLDGSIDIGLVPVAILPQMKNYQIVSDFGIACDGAVTSVCLYSKVPVDQIKAVILDYQSRTSVALAQILFKELWKVNPVFLPAPENFINQINGETAAVVIGDRALELNNLGYQVYDLGEAWKELTGLPFVFAAWISNREVSPAFIQQFNLANLYGLNNLAEVVKSLPDNNINMLEYYTRYINYNLDMSKKEGMAVFLKKLAELK